MWLAVYHGPYDPARAGVSMDDEAVQLVGHGP